MKSLFPTIEYYPTSVWLVAEKWPFELDFGGRRSFRFFDFFWSKINFLLPFSKKHHRSISLYDDNIHHPNPHLPSPANMSETAPLLANGRNGAIEPAVERTPATNYGLLRPDTLRRPSMKVGSYAHHPGHHDDDHHHHKHSHAETHSNNGDLIRDITIGFADGLTVPFALTAGLSSLGSTKIVVIGGLAELFSGMISMGLGAYLAAATERQHWQAEYERECWEVDHCKFPGLIMTLTSITVTEWKLTK